VSIEEIMDIIKNQYQKKVPIQKAIYDQIPVSKLWLDKYYPQTMSDIIGNQPQIRNLEVWLDTWDDCILHGHKKEQIKTGKKFAKNEKLFTLDAILSIYEYFDNFLYKFLYQLYNQILLLIQHSIEQCELGMLYSLKRFGIHHHISWWL